jgi:hypothetical protein
MLYSIQYQTGILLSNQINSTLKNIEPYILLYFISLTLTNIVSYWIPISLTINESTILRLIYSTTVFNTISVSLAISSDKSGSSVRISKGWVLLRQRWRLMTMANQGWHLHQQTIIASCGWIWRNLILRIHVSRLCWEPIWGYTVLINEEFLLGLNRFGICVSGDVKVELRNNSKLQLRICWLNILWSSLGICVCTDIEDGLRNNLKLQCKHFNDNFQLIFVLRN